jgi:hypothetical protein
MGTGAGKMGETARPAKGLNAGDRVCEKKLSNGIGEGAIVTLLATSGATTETTTTVATATAVTTTADTAMVVAVAVAAAVAATVAVVATVAATAVLVAAVTAVAVVAAVTAVVVAMAVAAAVVVVVVAAAAVVVVVAAAAMEVPLVAVMGTAVPPPDNAEALLTATDCPAAPATAVRVNKVALNNTDTKVGRLQRGGATVGDYTKERTFVRWWESTQELNGNQETYPIMGRGSERALVDGLGSTGTGVLLLLLLLLLQLVLESSRTTGSATAIIS